jgi:multiple sugar transport system substrate-binding protein
MTCTSKTPADDRIVLTWWQFWAEPYQKPVVRRLIEEFEHLHPKIKIEMTELTWSSGHDKIVAAFAAGRAPDVIELGSDWVYEFASRGVLADVTSSASMIKNNFMGWESCQFNEKIYAFPWLLGSRAIFYNKDIVKNDSIRAWNVLLTEVTKAHRPDLGIYGFGNTKKEPHQLYKKILPFFWSNGGDVLSDDQTQSIINSTSNIEALDFYLQLCNYGLLESQKNLDDAFVQGRIGFIFSGGWLIKKINDQNPGLHYGIMPFPQNEPSKPAFSFYGGEYLAINKQSVKIESAIEFIRFLTERERALRLCAISKVTLPAAVSASNDTYFVHNRHEKLLAKQLTSSRPSPIHPQWVKIENVIEDEVEQALYNRKTAKQALDSAHERIQTIIRNQ